VLKNLWKVSCLLLACNFLQADYIYENNQDLFDLTNQTGTTNFNVGDDQLSGAFNLDNTFTFYGNDYDSARMATNGCLHFGLGTGNVNYNNYCGDYTPDPLPQYTNTLFPFWTDLIRDNGSKMLAKNFTDKAVFGWYNLREYNRSNTDNSFEVILWNNNSYEFRYGALNIINHDVLIGEQGPTTSKIYTYLFHDECNTGTTNVSGTCVNTNWNNTSYNTTLENGGSLYSDGSDNSIDCSDPLNNSSCAGYAAAYLTQQCNITQLYSESCPSYWEAYDDQQCDEDPQYAPFCPGYTQEASVAYFVEDNFDYGYEEEINTQTGQTFYEEDIFIFEEELFFEEPYEEIVFFETEEILFELDFEEYSIGDIDPLPDFNVIEEIYTEIQVFEEPEFLVSFDDYEVETILINPSEELLEEFIFQEMVLEEEHEPVNSFVEFETIEELNEWFEEEIREEIEEEVEAIEEEIEEELIAEEEIEEEIEEEVELIAEEGPSRSGITSTMLNVVSNSVRAAANSVSSGGYSSGGSSSQGYSSTASNSTTSATNTANSSVSGVSTSSSPSMSDQITSANVQTNTILSLSQDTTDTSGGSSQTVSSVTTIITPMPSLNDNPQVAMAEVQVQDMQGQIDTAVSGVMTASEADQIADQIIANNIKEQQEQAETEQQETGQYADQSTLVAYLGYVPAFETYKSFEIPKQETWYEPREIYSNVVISDNTNAFYGLASTSLNTLSEMIELQPSL
tara:strand:- start:8081 stop:10288 length:2208 start_codon:yes stop_codon:yes gene_type:complete